MLYTLALYFKFASTASRQLVMIACQAATVLALHANAVQPTGGKICAESLLAGNAAAAAVSRTASFVSSLLLIGSAIHATIAVVSRMSPRVSITTAAGALAFRRFRV
eukprot:COSAG01_NODE_26914_length_699_cov_2.058333_1_plen_106_part_10